MLIIYIKYANEAILKKVAKMQKSHENVEKNQTGATF